MATIPRGYFPLAKADPTLAYKLLWYLGKFSFKSVILTDKSKEAKRFKVSNL